MPETFPGLQAEGLALGQRLVSRYRDLPQAISILATAYAESGDLTNAQGVWREHLARHPDTAEGWYRLGLYAVKEGRDAEAAEALFRASALDPNLPDIQGHLGRCLLKLDRVEDAVRVLAPVVGADRGGAIRLFHLGHAFLRQGRDSDAREAFRGAVELAPSYTGAHYGLATACGRLHLDGEAAEHRDEFRRLKSHDAEVAAANLTRDETLRMRQLLAAWYASAGRIAVLSGDERDAEALWLRGSAIAPGQADIRRLLRELFLRQRRHTEAQRLATETPPAADTDEGSR